MKAYFFAPDDSGVARPTLLTPCGYDSTAEKGYAYVHGALVRGYNAVSFEGPGQEAAASARTSGKPASTTGSPTSSPPRPLSHRSSDNQRARDPADDLCHRHHHRCQRRSGLSRPRAVIGSDADGGCW